MNGDCNQMKTIRLWYKKTGTAIYTSHLDMNRTFTRAVRRADIPLWYTEGFNPHPYLNFLLPLPLGQSGEKEPVDIRPIEDISNSEIKGRLNRVLPDGLEIVDVTNAIGKVNAVTGAKYEISLSFSSEGEATAFCAGINGIISSGVLNAEKRSKKGAKTVNLCDYIKSFEAEEKDLSVNITAVLATGASENLNAGLLVEALCKEFGAETEAVSIKRTDIYTANGELFE